MKRHRTTILLVGSVVAAGAWPGLLLAQAPLGQVDFARDIKPILSNNCFQCHGPDAAQRKGGTDGLRLDTAAGATEDLGGYAAVVPQQPEKSVLIERVSSLDPEVSMPPKSTGKRLSAAEVTLLKEWIRQGAKYAGHWSYAKPERPMLPAIRQQSWPRGAIDHFLLARLEREGLQPAAEADRYALIRRLSLDLTGLPPTLDEVDAFVQDSDPEAYEKLVDRLLQKPAYGEYWAHLWLDLARYADSAGYADDPARTIWLYRDYVIRSFNANKPFDQFTIEQLAGDLLPTPTEEQTIATAFHRNTLTNSEGGTNDEEFRNVAVVDRNNTTMAVWMGTTAACAQCHDHKYDPISQQEYFRLFAFFNNSEDADRNDEAPVLSVWTEEQQQKRALWQAEVARLEETLRTPTPEIRAAAVLWAESFPKSLKWQSPQPTGAKSQAGVAARVSADGAIQVPAGAKNDLYTVEMSLPAMKIRALRLETLPEAALPGKGPGHAGGNFILTRLSAVLTPPASQALRGRYVRVELPGEQRFLSLAEVQVFAAAKNIAPQGEATQSSTDFNGPAKLAIDGNTDGRFVEAASTSHTAASDNPWWEVDLKSEQPIERLVVWNRTDNGTSERLSNFRLLVLNEKHEPIWQQTIAAPPQPSTQVALDGQRPIEFDMALADYAQAGFEPAYVLRNPDAKQKGWAVGGQTGQAHSLTLVSPAEVEAPAGSLLTVTLEHAASLANHTLGHFRISLTDDAQVAQWSQTPGPVLEALQTTAADRSAEQQQRLVAHYASLAPELKEVRDKLAALNKQLAELKPVTVPIMKELTQSARRVTKIQHRGNFLDLGVEVTPGTPAAFPPLRDGAPPNRLTLARWLIDDNNPLTARVVANRYWEQIFGIGIVSTSEEFGSQGESPFHPELLDWLATELVRLRWDVKAFVRLLVTSAAYRQSSQIDDALQQRDPDNRLLARGPRFRLSAETVRDQALFVSGLLSSRLYGPPVKPLQPATGLSAAFGSGIDWQTSTGDDKYRRALYTTWRRSNPYPSMTTFDAPNREVCTVRRIRTNTPLQALVTLNDPVFIEAAQALARRIVASGGSSPEQRARWGFRLCLARPPHQRELARLVQLFQRARDEFEKTPLDAARLATEPLGPASKDANLAELAAWTLVGNVLLNLDETLMKR